MNMSPLISWIVRIGIAAGILVTIIGAMFNGSIVKYGVLILILTPFIAVIGTLIPSLANKDWYWSAVSLALIAIVVVGVLIAI